MSQSLQILLAEDEPLIALDLEGALVEAGYRVLGPARDCASALRLIAGSPPDCAVLDVGLADGSCLPVALELASRGIPFVLATAFDRIELDHPVLTSAPTLAKPFTRETVVEALQRLIAVTTERDGSVLRARLAAGLAGP